MIAISHPTGNEFVRALLLGCHRDQRELRFYTSLAFQADSGLLRLATK